MQQKTVWLYEDAGVGAVGLACLEADVRHFWGAKTRRVNAEALRAGIDADVLIVGGGADLPYCARLNGAGTAAIKRFVAAGGVYLGVCAGAYFACQQVDFIGADYLVYGTRELAFFRGIARGSLPQFTQGRYYDETEASRAFLTLSEFPEQTVLYHGGCTFIGDLNAARVLAYYPQSALPAIITGTYGQGRFILSGVHFEGLNAAEIYEALY